MLALEIVIFGTRHKYQLATLRYGAQALPISAICLGFGLVYSFLSRLKPSITA